MAKPVDIVWWPCPGCGHSFRDYSLFACAQCERRYCQDCSRAVKLFNTFTGQKVGEGWMCYKCRQELGPDGYRPVFRDDGTLA